MFRKFHIEEFVYGIFKNKTGHINGGKESCVNCRQCYSLFSKTRINLVWVKDTKMSLFLKNILCITAASVWTNKYHYWTMSGETQLQD